MLAILVQSWYNMTPNSSAPLTSSSPLHPTCSHKQATEHSAKEGARIIDADYLGLI